MKMSKEELIKLVTKIRKADFKTEEAYDNAIWTFMANVPDPEASDLIFHHKPKLTPEEIVAKALAYKPIIIPPYDEKSNND